MKTNNKIKDTQEAINFFLIQGYWKDDKSPIEQALVSVDVCNIDAEDIEDTTTTNGVQDQAIFYYGLNEQEIQRIIQEGESNDQVDFVITSYKPFIVPTVEDQTHYFILSDEDGHNMGVIKAKDSRELESMIIECTREHKVYDDASLENSLSINEFIGNPKEVTVTLSNAYELPQHYDIRVEPTLLYNIKSN